MEAHTMNAIEIKNAKDELIQDETTLRTVASVILIVGMLLSFILFFTVGLVLVNGEHTVNWMGLVSSITTLLFSIGVWAFLKVVSNISISLKGGKS